MSESESSDAETLVWQGFSRKALDAACNGVGLESN